MNDRPAGSCLLPDPQSSVDQRNLLIDEVGICALNYPIRLRLGGDVQATHAQWSFDVELPADQKGTHMSRFIALIESDVLADDAEPLDLQGFARLAQRMVERLEAPVGHLQADFRLFVHKTAPVSGVRSYLDYEVSVRARGGRDAGVFVSLSVPVKSLCPCSRSISDYGAHNQRSRVDLHAELDPDRADLLALIRRLEAQGSSEIWTLLKRVDEKLVTEQAYDNPKFVEDLVRDMAQTVAADDTVGAFSVRVENFESIHNHSAWARVRGRGAWADAVPQASLVGDVGGLGQSRCSRL